MSRYPSKILLFGEYAIIHRSMALAIPYSGFFAEWKTSLQKQSATGFADYLDDLEVKDILFDKQLYQMDQSQGLSLISNIPQGYGVGSSGALTAAFFERYIIRNKEFSVTELQAVFAKMESYFHGSSSGFDPLISYLNAGVILDSEKRPKVIDHTQRKKYVFYLLNSRKRRETSPLVKIYLENYKNLSFKNNIDRLSLLNKKAINAYIDDQCDLLDIFKEISHLQRQVFDDMILPEMSDRFKNLDLKLCGAGGGGYYLGITDRADIPNLISQHDVILLH